MTKFHSAIAISAALTTAPSVAALSLNRRPMSHTHISPNNRRATSTTQWMLPNNIRSAFGSFQQRSSNFLPFRAIMEKPKDESSDSSSEEEKEEDEGKAWVVPTPPSSPPPPKPVITESRAATATEENVLGEKIANEIINPLIVNPSIKQEVPSDVIQGAFINGSFLAFLTAYFIYGPFIPLLQTIVAAFSIGVITSYVSITEGSAGEFVRTVGKFTKDVTDMAVSQVEEWQESGQLDKVSKTIGSGAKSLMDTAVKEVAARQEEPIIQLSEGSTAEEAEATRRARVEGKSFAFEDAGIPSKTQVAEGMTADEAEEARLARLNEDKKIADEKRAAAEAKKKAEEEEAKAIAAAQEKAKAAAEAEAKRKAEEEAKAAAEAEAKRKAEEEAARQKEEARLAEFARLAEENRIKEEAEERAAEQARLEEARRLEEQAEAAREAVRLMAEQEALMDDEDEDDDDFMDDDDWEASVRLANELSGIGGGSEQDKMMDELLQEEMGDLSEEEEAALGKAARAAVLKYEQEMRERGVAPIVEEDDDEKVVESEPIVEETKNVDYSSMTVAELKDILRSKGLKVGGKKAELIERLEESS
ncbi:hypothetical protein ACHAWC_002405 [Mediolabrus comicus]